MNIKSIFSGQSRKIAICFALFLLPILILILSLVRTSHWGDALDALQGKYLIHGVPSNPWEEFLPIFCLAIIISIGLFWLAISTASNSWPTLLKSVIGVLLMLLASIAFGISTALAATSHLWFQDTLVIGSIASVTPFWLSTLCSFVIFLGILLASLTKH